MKLYVYLVVLLLVAGSALADHGPVPIDEKALPYPRIYDPIEREHYDITDMTFAELDVYLGQPRFRKWNDVVRVCQSMEIMYGQVSRNCGPIPEAYFPRRATQRAYVTLEITPPPVYVPEPRMVVLVDPMYPPWSPQLYPYW
jgi:hypothetical protein